MFDIGWSELAVIAVVALVVIGPKDLPKVLRTAGYWMRKVRTIASEFQSSIEQMAREADLDDLRKQVEEANKAKAELERNFAADAAKIAEDASKLFDDPSIAPPTLLEDPGAPALAPPDTGETALRLDPAAVAAPPHAEPALAAPAPPPREEASEPAAAKPPEAAPSSNPPSDMAHRG